MKRHVEVVGRSRSAKSSVTEQPRKRTRRSFWTLQMSADSRLSTMIISRGSSSRIWRTRLEPTETRSAHDQNTSAGKSWSRFHPTNVDGPPEQLGERRTIGGAEQPCDARTQRGQDEELLPAQLVDVKSQIAEAVERLASASRRL